MSLYFSASAGGFFDDDIHEQLPADARPLSAARHAELMDLQGQGLVIAADANGDPVAIEPPPLPTDQRLAALRARRDRLLRDSDQTQLPDYPIAPELRADWATYRQALRDFPETLTDLDAVEWPAAPAL